MDTLVEPNFDIKQEEEMKPKRKKKEIQIEPTIIEEQEVESSFTFTKRSKAHEFDPDAMPDNKATTPEPLDNTIEEDQHLVNNLDRLISWAEKPPVELSMHLTPDLFSMTLEQSRLGMLSAFEDASAIGD